MTMFSEPIDIDDLESKIVGLADEVREVVTFLENSGRFKIRKEWKLSDREIVEKVNASMGSFITSCVNELILEYLILEHGSDKQVSAYDELQDRAGQIVKHHFEAMAGDTRRKAKDPKREAVMVLEYLNEKRKEVNSRNRGFRTEDKANLKDIMARIRDGYSFPEFQCVIDHKCRSWGGKTVNGKKMEQYLRPGTLFASGHFSQYLTEAESAAEEKKASSLDNELDGFLK